MSRFARVLRGLQRVFPSSDISAPSPSELSDSVVPVFPFPGNQGSIERCQAFGASTAAAVTPSMAIGWNNAGQVLVGGVLAAFQGFEVYTEIIYADLSHDSATDRAIQMFLQTPDTPVINTAIARWSDFASARIDGQPSGFNPVFAEQLVEEQAALTAITVLHPHRPILVPPSWKLFVTGDTAGIAYTISLQMIAIVHPLAEPPLLF